jgi:hypothetical protein
MSEDSETDQRQVSDSFTQEDELANAVQEAIDDWVANDEIPVYRAEGKIVAEEDVLRQNILVMVAIAVDQTAD